MTYEQAKKELDKSNVKLNSSSYTIQTNNSNQNNGMIITTSYLLIDITITPKNKLKEIKLLKTKLLNDGALKYLGLFDNSDLEVMLTFYYDQKPPIIRTLAEYLAYLRDNPS